MALIPLFHVIPAKATVDPNSLAIRQGMFVALNGAAGCRRVTTGDDGNVYGVAGDNYATTSADYSLPGLRNTDGTVSGWQNRVSDMWNETQASGMMTVYHSGGEFATDQFVDTNMDAANVGDYLRVDETTGTLENDGTTETVNSVAVLTQAAGTYPSGVPGIDLNGDMALTGENSNQYIVFKLII